MVSPLCHKFNCLTKKYCEVVFVDKIIRKQNVSRLIHLTIDFTCNTQAFKLLLLQLCK